MNAGNITTTAANEVVIAGFVNRSAPHAAARALRGSGYTMSSFTSESAVSSEYKIVSSTGTYTGDATLANDRGLDRHRRLV
jgi:hypothetical protein